MRSATRLGGLFCRQRPPIAKELRVLPLRYVQ